MKFSQRRAISPIIATVLIIAVTLIAAVAIGGFVFGIFGSSSNSGEIQVTGIALVANTESSAGAGSVTCVTYSAANSLTLTNTGTAATTVTAVSITFGGAVFTYSVSGCTVTPAGEAGAAAAGNPLTLVLTGIGMTAATSGASYTGTVTMGNGAILIFAGTFI
jgi:archaeal type IV pilus assembly protein PilA